MHKITAQEINKAFQIWYTQYKFKDVERKLEPFLQDSIKPLCLNKIGWLEQSRNSLFLSGNTVAEKLNISRAAYAKYEESERKGTISLATLARAADVMDCELVYAIRPKRRKSFSKMIWQKLLTQSLMHPWLNSCDQKKRYLALAEIAKRYMQDPVFRRAQCWSQRANQQKQD
jgi:transcriptional regulator with XRE-family HTH domain